MALLLWPPPPPPPESLAPSSSDRSLDDVLSLSRSLSRSASLSADVATVNCLLRREKMSCWRGWPGPWGAPVCPGAREESDSEPRTSSRSRGLSSL